MELTATDLDDLATFFGRRLDIQLTPVPPPRSHAEARQRAMAWLLTLEEAQDAGRLSALVHRISKMYPNDPTLQSACALLTDPGRAADRVLGLVLIAGATAFVAATGVVLGGFAGMLIAAAGAPAQALGPPPAPEAFAEWAVEGEVLTPQRVVSTPAVGRCSKEDGGIVGYWYAGSSAPGAAGDVLQMDRMINVRQTFPDPKNGFDSRTHIECVIRPGDRIELSVTPVQLPGHHFWVPLYSGDLTPGASGTDSAG